MRVPGSRPQADCKHAPVEDQPHDAPERYEQHEGPAYSFGFDRRDFFRVLGGGLAIALVFKDATGLQESGGGRGRGGRQAPSDIRSWLHIGADGGVTILTGKVEVGQNIRTSLTQVVAEELKVSLSAISMVMGDTDLTPYDAGTFGSRTTPVMSLQLRRVAVAARELLLDLAAAEWSVDRASLTIEDGRVIDGTTGRTVGIGELAEGRELVRTVSEDDPLSGPEEWKVAGTSVPKVDGHAFVTGAHEYPSDIEVPDMLFGKVLRPASFNATVVSIDTSAAAELPGVTVVQDGDFVGVTAATDEEAFAAIAAIRTEWLPSSEIGGRELYDYLRRTASEEQGGGRGRSSARTAGSMEEGMAAADSALEATYTVAYIAHAPLEPRAAVASWEGDKLTVWTGTQRPFGVRSELAQAFRVPEERVRVIMPDTGSGYGGKHTGEAAVEAARLARAAGRPVKLVWTRQEEFTWAYFRPAGVIDVASGVRADGTLTAWEFHNYNSGGSGIDTRYEVPNRRIQFHRTEYPLRQGSYRGLAATANHFARETHMDELAEAVGLDPLEFRLKNLTDDRMRAVLEAAADAFGWIERSRLPNRGSGLAVGYEKGGYIATCAEVAIGARGDVAIIHVVAAFECGAIINPKHLENQVEGSIVQGIGGAMFEAVEFDSGRILNPGFAQYRLPRFSDMPDIEIVLLDRQDLPSAGAGETPIVGIAPAVGNAIFEATGQRLRSLPLVPNGLPTSDA